MKSSRHKHPKSSLRIWFFFRGRHLITNKRTTASLGVFNGNLTQSRSTFSTLYIPFYRFWNQLRRRSPTAAVPWLPLVTWSPSKLRNEWRGTNSRSLTPLFCFRLLHLKDRLSFVLPILKRYSLLHDESKIFYCFVHRGKLICHHENLRCFALILQLVFATYDCSIRKNVTIRLLMHRNALFEAVHNFSSFFWCLIDLSSFSHCWHWVLMAIKQTGGRGGSHKHLFTSVKHYLQFIYCQCHRILIYTASSHF